MPALSDFAGRGPLRCKRPFVDADGNIWLPGDPLQFSASLPGEPHQFAAGPSVLLRLLPSDIEQGEVLLQPELYFELPPLDA